MITIISEENAEELIRSMSAQRVEAMRAAFEADLMAAWEKGKEEGKAESVGEGEFRGRKQGVIHVAMNCLREGVALETVAKAAELPVPIIRKIAQNNGIELP